MTGHVSVTVGGFEGTGVRLRVDIKVPSSHYEMTGPVNPILSIVIPVYNEAQIIEVLVQRLRAVLGGLSFGSELIFVDDGSVDGTLEKLRHHQGPDETMTVIELSRNWGHQAAITAGLSVATAAAVVVMDGDLQDPPEVIPRFVAAWQQGAQVVIAQRTSRQDSILRRALFRSFYAVLGFLADRPIPLDAGVFGLMDRAVVNEVLKLEERNRFLPGLRSYVGFRSEVVYYDREQRAGGAPKQTFWRLLKYGMDAVFSFSYKPLRLSLVCGLAVGALGIVYGMLLIALRFSGRGLFGQPVVVGYTSTIVCILMLGSTQLITLGILGEYLGRIYDEVKRRPLFIIRKIYRSPGAVPGASPGYGDK